MLIAPEPGDALGRPDNRNVLLVLRVDGPTATVLYLDNVDPSFVGTGFEHSVDYLSRKYRRHPEDWWGGPGEWSAGEALKGRGRA